MAHGFPAQEVKNNVRISNQIKAFSRKDFKIHIQQQILFPEF